MTDPVVGIVGLKALRRDINKLVGDERSALFQAMKRAGLAAVQPTAAAARAALPTSSGRLAGSVRASGSRSGGTVREGRPSVPYAGWVDFGGTRPDGSSRDYQPGGRFLFPAAQGDAARAASAYSDELSRLFASSGIWTNTETQPGGVHD